MARPVVAFTYFFRDSQTLELAIEGALPRLQGRAFIHIWDAGCAHGPEPYTLAILMRERLSDYIFRNVHIHATDVDGNFGPQVTSGIFSQPEVRRVPPAIFEKYFRPAPQPGLVEIAGELRAKVKFSHHDLLSLQPVREGLSMIVCKNVLLHLDHWQRLAVLGMFHQALQPGGILVMEQTQKLPEELATSFRQLVPHAQVYQRLGPALVAHPAEPDAFSRHRQHADVAGDHSLPGSGRRRFLGTSR